jgi:hypothetical protein
MLNTRWLRDHDGRLVAVWAQAPARPLARVIPMTRFTATCRECRSIFSRTG